MNEFIDLTAVASESPAESIAHENEIVEHIAHEHDYPEQPSDHPIDEQLGGLIDPAVIRSEHTWPVETSSEWTHAPQPRRPMGAILRPHS